MADQTGPKGQSTQALTLACRAEGSKTGLPEGVCPLFLSRLGQVLPGRDVTLAGPQAQPVLTLVVTRSGKGQFAARIDQGMQPGPERAMARRGAALDDAALSQFLDDLIAATPDLR